MTSAVMSDLSVSFDPLRDKSYRRTRLGRSVVDFLAWKRIGRTTDRTLDQYERDLARGALMFPKFGIEDWTAAEMSHVAASFDDAERDTRLAPWRGLFRWAILFDYRETNPCDKLHPIKRERQGKIDIFSEPEIRALTGLPLQDGLLFQLMFDVGLRKGECRRCRVDWFRPDANEFFFQGKGGKWRTVPATPTVSQRFNELVLLDGLEARDQLWYRSWRNLSGNGIKRDRPIGEATFVRWWERCLDDAGVKYRHPHTTRHTFATRYLREGGDVTRLKRLMGHVSITTTDDLYSHLDTRDLHEEFARIFGAVSE